VGVKFGFRFWIIGDPIDAPVMVKVVIAYPDAGAMSPTSGLLHTVSYSQKTHIGVMNSFAGYSVDEALGGGAWTLDCTIVGRQ